MKVVVILVSIVALLIALDIATGCIKAFKEKKFTSSVMREGMFHKFAEVVLIALGVLLDYAQRYADLGFSVPLTISICVYIILMEAGSIVENAGKINPKLVPSVIKTCFSKLTKEGE